jgi:hypothetical protein
MSGLPMVTQSSLKSEDADGETALSALSSLVVPTGDTIARELSGDFVNMSVRTTGGLLLSTVIDSDPKVVLTAIVDENLETTITHEMLRLQPIISNAVAGIATEINDRQSQAGPDQRKVKIFFDSFLSKVNSAVTSQDLISIIRAAKEDLYTLVSSGTISYEMNRYVLSLQKVVQNKTSSSETVLKIKKEINQSVSDWKTRLNTS